MNANTIALVKNEIEELQSQVASLYGKLATAYRLQDSALVYKINQRMMKHERRIHLLESAINFQDPQPKAEVTNSDRVYYSYCPSCGGKPGHWGAGTCSSRCWGDIYGEW